MPDVLKVPRYQMGDKVRLKFGTPLVGTVMEARPAYAAHANILYRVYVPMEPEPLYLELREEEIEKV